MNAIVAAGLEALLGGLGRLLVQILNGLRDRHTFDKVLALAEVHVGNFAKADVSGPEKQQLAQEAIKADLVAVGLEARDSLVNLAIELAVNAAKSAVEDAIAPKAGGGS